MSYSLSKKEMKEIAAMSADKRLDYFIQAIVEFEEVWSLDSKEGWVVLSADHEECLPVWPHKEFAEQWATGDWADCTPKAIDLETWMERWVPGMREDGTLLAVFPNSQEEGVVAEPDDIEVLVFQELEQREKE